MTTSSIHLINPEEPPQGVIIWLHGLGANGADMEGLASQLPLADLPLRHVFLTASERPITINGGLTMPAWYDIVGFSLADREDSAGIHASAKWINEVIEEQISSGIKAQRIVLAGFSQGGAMALYTALNATQPIAGVMALSAYLPLSQDIKPTLDCKTPMFIAAGRFDEVVKPQWTELSSEWLTHHGYKALECHDYPMEHAICHEEIHDMAIWLRRHLLLGDNK